MFRIVLMLIVLALLVFFLISAFFLPRRIGPVRGTTILSPSIQLQRMPGLPASGPKAEAPGCRQPAEA
ncbi:MAG TPA: hypothetical protein VGK99_04690 [Acidobacteriota bacterium]|jgi:hypothetical protein